MKNKIKGKGIAIQRDTKNNNGKALPKDNFRLKEGFKKNTWQKHGVDMYKTCKRL